MRSTLAKVEKRYEGLTQLEKVHEKIILAYVGRVIAELKPLIERNDSENESLLNGLDAFLKRNARLVTNNMLSYTSRTLPEINALIYTIAVYVYEAEKNKRHLLNIVLPELKGLYPLAPLQQKYPELGSDAIHSVEDLQHIMNMHVLGDGGHYLLPVRLVLNEEDEWHNPYYDLFLSENMPELAWVSETEKKRLLNHSAKVQTLQYAREKKNRIENDPASFLGHLNAFIRSLKASSVDGVGIEDRAADSSFKEIYDFFVYYDALQDEKDKIPNEIQGEIERIRFYAGSKESFLIEQLDGKEVVSPSIESCLQTRYNYLERIKRSHEKLLLTIACDEEFKKEQLEAAREELEAYKSDFINEYESNQYIGRESLGFNLALLKELNIKLTFKDFQDVVALKDFSVTEIAEVLSSEESRAEIFAAIGTIENCLILSIELSLQKLEVLLSGISGYFPFQEEDVTHWSYVENRIFLEELSSFLMPLDENRARLVIQIFSNKLSSFVTRGYTFSHLCKVQPSYVIKIFYELLKHSLCDSIGDSDDISYILSVLAPAEIMDFCKLLDASPDLTERKRYDVSGYAELFEALSPEQIIAYLNVASKDFIDIVLADNNVLEQFLSSFLLDENASNDEVELEMESKEKIAAAYDSLKNTLTHEQALYFLQFLSSEGIHDFYLALKEKGLMEVMRTRDMFCLLYAPLSEEDKTDCYKIIGNTLPTLIKTSLDFKLIMQVLDKEKIKQQTSLLGYEAMKALIESASLFHDIVPPLDQGAQWPFIKRILTDSPFLIQTTSDYLHVLELIPEEKLDALMVIITEKIETLRPMPDNSISEVTRPKFFNRSKPFVLKALPILLEKEVLNFPEIALQYYFQEYGKTNLFLNPKVKKAYEERLYNLDALASFMWGMHLHERKSFIRTFHSFLVGRLKKSADLSDFILKLPMMSAYWGRYNDKARINISVFINELKPVVNAVIRSIDDLIMLLLNLEKDYSLLKTVFDVCIDSVEGLPINIRQFERLSKLTPYPHQYDVLRMFGGAAISQVESTEDFDRLFQSINLTHCDFKLSHQIQSSLFENLKEDIGEIINSPRLVNQFLQLFDTLSVKSVLKKLSPNVLEINSWQPLFTLLQGLLTSQIKDVMASIKTVDLDKSGFQLDAFLESYHLCHDINTQTLLLQYYAETITSLFDSHESIINAVKRLEHDTFLGDDTLTPLLLLLKKEGLIDRDFMLDLLAFLSQKDISPNLRNMMRHILVTNFNDESLDVLMLGRDATEYDKELLEACFNKVWRKVFRTVGPSHYEFHHHAVSQYEVYYTLSRMVDRLIEGNNLYLAIDILKAFKAIFDRHDSVTDYELSKQSEKALREDLINALHTPDSPLYKALNTHASTIPITLWGPDGRFGFFSRETNTLRKVRDASEGKEYVRRAW
jgi:hypothetical protein